MLSTSNCVFVIFEVSLSGVCLNQRIASHKVFDGLAERGKTSTGWFFGFKLHLVINDRGELLNVILTSGNMDDRKPVPKLVHKLFGKVFGDKGYISQLLLYGEKNPVHSRNRGWRLPEIFVDDASQNILPSNQTFCTSRRA